MLTMRALPVAILQILLLLALGLLLRWGTSGWVAAFASVAVVDAAAVRLARAGRVRAVGPADGVTLTRATLTCGVVALVAESWGGASHQSAGVATLAAVSLALDWVDGRVARSTGGGSAFGARVDGEADAYLLLVLSVWVAAAVGWWVLVIGLARYAFAAVGWVLPWMRAQLPYRYWRKVVTATAGVALTLAAAEVAPDALVMVGLVVSVLLIAESFGRDIWWLRSHRPARTVAPAAGVGPA